MTSKQCNSKSASLCGVIVVVVAGWALSGAARGQSDEQVLLQTRSLAATCAA